MTERTATVPAGLINPPRIRDQQRKYNEEEDEPLATIAVNAYESTYGAPKEDRSFWKAVVMRVDRYEEGVAYVKARIPEVDAAIPEPVEWVSPKIKSCSHYLIDMHRTYVGQSDTAPTIGQIIVVNIDSAIYSSKSGKIMGLTDKYVTRGIKSTKITSGAKTAAEAPQVDAAFPPTPGDGIGSGERNAASQVPTSAPASSPASASRVPR